MPEDEAQNAADSARYKRAAIRVYVPDIPGDPSKLSAGGNIRCHPREQLPKNENPRQWTKNEEPP